MTYINEIKISDQPVGIDLKKIDSKEKDAFSRLKTSSPTTIFDNKQIFDNTPLFWDDAQTSGSNTSSTHSVNRASTTISVANLTAGTRVRQTKRWFNYQPGKSQLINMTGVLSEAANGITKRIGQFNENNGIFFQLQGSVFSVVIRSYVSGSVANTVVTQSNWNVDKLDGTGKSGITIDVTKANIFVIDYEWLGVGSVRMGFVIDGSVVICHQFTHANKLTSVYMSSPNLPLRYEISNDGSGPSSSLEHICTSVISEGGQEPLGLTLSAFNKTHIDANVLASNYALIGIRLKTTYLGATIVPISTNILATTAGDALCWQLILNPTVNGTFNYSGLSNSALEIAYGSTANTVTGGTILDSGFNAELSTSNQKFNTSLHLGSTINGTVDALVLAAYVLTGSNLDIFGCISWRELQ